MIRIYRVNILLVKLTCAKYSQYVCYTCFFFLNIYKIDPETWSMGRLFSYFKRNLRQFTHLVRTGQFDKIFRPGRFSPNPINNAEKILDFGADVFYNFANSTKQRYVSNAIYIMCHLNIGNIIKYFWSLNMHNSFFSNV